MMNFKMDGTTFTDDSTGLIISYNEVECQLSSLYTIDAGSGPMPFYRYNVSLSNDGVVFSEPFSPAGSGAVVYDSTCIQCTDDGDCHQLVSCF